MFSSSQKYYEYQQLSEWYPAGQDKRIDPDHEVSYWVELLDFLEVSDTLSLEENILQLEKLKSKYEPFTVPDVEEESPHELEIVKLINDRRLKFLEKEKDILS